MENFCEKCKIKVEEDRSHCPLCGKCTNENNLSRPRLYKNYPDYEGYYVRRTNVTRILTLVLIAVNIIWLALSFAVWGKYFLGFYILAGSVAVFLTVLLPIANRHSIAKQSAMLSVVISGLIIFVELYSKTVGWGFAYVLPFWFMAVSISSSATLASRGYYKAGSFYPMFLVAVMAAVLFSLKFTVLSSIGPLWPALAAFAACLGTWLVMFLFYRKRILKALRKDFHVKKDTYEEV